MIRKLSWLKVAGLALAGVGAVLSSIQQKRDIDEAVERYLDKKEKEAEEASPVTE